MHLLNLSVTSTVLHCIALSGHPPDLLSQPHVQHTSQAYIWHMNICIYSLNAFCKCMGGSIACLIISDGLLKYQSSHSHWHGLYISCSCCASNVYPHVLPLYWYHPSDIGQLVAGWECACLVQPQGSSVMCTAPHHVWAKRALLYLGSTISGVGVYIRA